MPTYRVLEKSFINNAIREEGELVEYNGRPSKNLELVSGGEIEEGEAFADEAPKAKWKPKAKRASDTDESAV